MYIRIANEEDALAVSSLVMNTAQAQLRNEFSNDGWTLFQRLLSVKTQKDLINSKQFYYLLAVAKSTSTQKEKIIGVLAIKDSSHLFHFFINPDYQGKGIGRLLWYKYLQQIKAISIPKKISKITVNASDFAAQFYLKLGFVSGR